MASTLDTKIRTSGNTKRITYITNDSEVTTNYSGWWYHTETTYRFYYYGIVLASNNFTLSVYENDVYVGTITATYSNGTDFSWNGTATHHGINLSISCGAGSLQLIDEKFTLYKEDTLANDDALFGASDKIYKIKLIHSGGTDYPYHEQITTPTYNSSSIGSNNITWYFKNTDPDINVDMYARVGTASFTLKASNVAPNGQGTLAFTGLSQGTAYNVDVYCVPTGESGNLATDEDTRLKKVSAEGTDTRTTTNPVKTWVYQGTSGTYTSSWQSNLSPPTCAKYTTSSSLGWLNTNRSPSLYAVGYKARVYVYDTALPFPNHCGYHYYEVELV